MTERHDPTVTLGWMNEGTEHLLGAVAALDPGTLMSPSRLPGWTRAHLIGHVARNAEALVRLVSWARTGIENPMYESTDQRSAEIASTATLRPGTLLGLVVDTASQLDAARAQVDKHGWEAPVKTALGRTVPAAEIPWMRIREVWIHAIDLGADLSFADFPPGAIDLLLDDTVAALSSREGCPSITLAPGARTRTWALGPASDDAPVVDDSAALLAQWLTGRLPDADRPESLPDLPRWI